MVNKPHEPIISLRNTQTQLQHLLQYQHSAQTLVSLQGQAHG